MSRSGYIDDGWSWDMIMYRGSVARAIRGKRGQAFLREMLAAMDAMPEKRLIEAELIDERGEVCAMGTVCAARRLDVSAVDPECHENVAKLVGLADSMVREIAYENDECGPWDGEETPEHRWTRMRAWIEKQIRPSPASRAAGGEG